MSEKLNLDDIDIDYWTFDLGGFTDNLYKEILIFNINKEDLLNENSDNLEEIGRIDAGDWDAFASILSQKEADLNKEEAELYTKELKEDDCDDCEEGCTCEYFINTTYLYCENQYVHSASSYDKEESY